MITYLTNHRANERRGLNFSVTKQRLQAHATPAYEPAAEAIAQRAHLAFQNNGSSDGRHLEDWHRAKAVLIAEHFDSHSW